MDLLTIPFTLLSYATNPPPSLQQALSQIYTFPPTLAQIFYTLGILWLSLQIFGFAVSWIRTLVRTFIWISLAVLAISAYTMGSDAVFALLGNIRDSAVRMAGQSEMIGEAMRGELPRQFVERMAQGQRAAGAGAGQAGWN